MTLPVALIAISYTLGSLPFSWIVVRLVAGKDLREHGSRNVGATNVARTSGRVAGVIALLLDLAKGWGAVTIARWIVAQPGWPFGPGVHPWESREAWIAFAGLVAVLAHMFPVWLRFHGGKGVATATGVFLALDPRVVAASLIVFAIVLLTTRFVSLASILAAASIPIFFRFLAHDAPFWRIVISIVIAILIILKHHSNIARIVAGTERRMGERKN